MKTGPATVAPSSPPREVRYSLRDLLVAVEEERKLGNFGTEKMRQSEVRQLFKQKVRKDRG
jgi:hypothetical protein